MVLLKNDGILPLKEESLESIGVIGPNAYSQAALYGNYHGDSDEYITNLDGIRRAVGDKIRIFYSQGCHLYIAADDPLCRPGRLLGEAEAVVKNSDVVILCVGLDERMEGEQGDEGNAFASGDKENLLLPEDAADSDRARHRPGQTGGAGHQQRKRSGLSAYEHKVSAIIQAWYSGERGGEALANILFGKTNPSGSCRLPSTITDSPCRSLPSIICKPDLQVRGGGALVSLWIRLDLQPVPL